MTTNDFDRTAQEWLAEGPTQLSDRVLKAALDEIHVTPQRRSWWPARRFTPMSKAMRVAVVVGAVVLAVAGIRFLAPQGGTGGPGPSPTPSPRLLAVGESAQLEPGTYLAADPFLARVLVTVPARWQGNMGGPYAVYLESAVGPGAVYFFVFDKVYADPCHLDQGFMNPLPGPSVDALATALTTWPGLVATAPTDVTLYGYKGKQLTLTAPVSFDACASSTFRLWQLPLGADIDMTLGERDRISILDVAGQRLVIDVPEVPGTTPEVQAEVQAVLDSIRISPAPAATPSPTP